MNSKKPSILCLFSFNVRKWRTDKGLTQSQLAEKTGISVRHLSDIERADTFPSPEIIETIALAFEIPSYILFLPDETAKKEMTITSELIAVLDEEIEIAINKAYQKIKDHKS